MADWKPTVEQNRILNPSDSEKNKSMLISAAAGSGKTKVLTEKIIKILTEEKDINLNNILVMTFTVKATQEMKSRIKNRIDEELRANPDDGNLIKASATIQNANITTIDSFCKNIVDKYYTVLNKSDSLYKNFDPGYRIADEKELSILYDDILDKFLEEIVYADESKYGEFLSVYLKKDIDTDIKEKLFIKAYYFLTTIPDAIDKIDEWKKNCTNILGIIEKVESDNINKELPSIKEEIENNAKVFKDKNLKNFEELFYDLIKEYFLRVTKEKISRNIYAISDYAILTYEILKYGGDILINELKNMYKYIFVDEYQDTSIIQELILNKIAKDDNLFMVGDVKQSIYRFRHAEPKIFLDKINDYHSNKDKSKYNLISMNKNFRSSSKIIEFTNTIFENIMTKDFAGIDYKNDGLMIHKDWIINTDGTIDKESNVKDDDISSKNVEIHIVCEKSYYDIANVSYKEKRIDKIKKDVESLNKKTYKQDKARINRDNKVKKMEEELKIMEEEVKVLKDKLAKSLDTINDNQNINTLNADGIFNQFENNTDSYSINQSNTNNYAISPEENGEALEKEEEEKIAANKIEAEFIASKIERLVKEEGVEYRDIVILFRAFYSRADIYLDAFKKHNIPVYAQMKKGFFDRMEIRLMIDILNVIDNEQQDIPVANVLCSNIFGLTNDEMAYIKLAALKQDRGSSFISCIKLSKDCLKYINAINYEEEIDKEYQFKTRNSEVYYKNKIDQLKNEIDKIKKDSKDESKLKELENEIKYLESESIKKKDEYDIIGKDLKEKVKSYIDFQSEFNYTFDFDELQKKLSNFIEKFDDLRTCARYYSISELIEKIFDELNVKNIMLSMNDGLMRTANLDELYELACRYENSSFAGLFNFLRYIEKIKELKDDQGLAQICDENDNVVRIMSIHQSKGLEFNYVFVSGCGSIYNTRDSWKSNLLQTDIKYGIALDDFNLSENYCIQSYLKNKIAEDKKYENMKEEMRMLYVAITRAKKRLFITAAVNRGNNGLSFKKAYVTYVEKYKHHYINFEAEKMTKDDNNNIENDCQISSIENVSAKDGADTQNNNTTTKDEKTINKLNSYIDLILSSVTKDSKCCDVYSDLITIDNIDENMTTKLKLQDVLNEKDESEDSVDDNKTIKDLLINLDDEKLKENIDSKYDYDYLSEIIKPKFSVSEIKKEHYDLKILNRQKNKVIDEAELIDFADDKERKDSTNIGNVYHTFMQFFNFQNVDDTNERFASIVLDDENENRVNRKEELKEKFNLFLKSDFAKDIIKAYNNKNKLFREYKFMQLISQNDINKYLSKYGIKNLPEIKINENEKIEGIDYFDEKNIVIQGIIDAFYVDDDDEIVVIDWKTDGISSGHISEKELIDNYQVQLHIYSKVLAELTGLKVKKRYIYSFTLNKAIELEELKD